MRRRNFIARIAGLVVTWPIVTRAQQEAQKIRKIGYLSGGSPSPLEEDFESGLRDLGWTKGKNVTIEYRRAEGRADRLPGLAGELVQMNVDLIVAPGPPARQAMEATSTIPIVFVLGADPVAWGLVNSFERPDRNLTGTMESNPELTATRLRLLKEAAPGVARVAILWQPGTLTSARYQDVLKNAQAEANTLRVQHQIFEAQDAGQFEKAFADMAGAQVNGLVVMQSPMFVAQRQAIIDLAAKQALPAIYEWGVYAASGGLISYGANLSDEYRRAAPYVDKILKGAKPAELPVEQPMKFELVINLKTAKTLGLTMPQSLVARAAKVIE
jgi:putative ABC transport system substrate-binding protein